MVLLLVLSTGTHTVNSSCVHMVQYTLLLLNNVMMLFTGWTYEDSPDDAAMKEVGDAVSAAIFEVKL